MRVCPNGYMPEATKVPSLDIMLHPTAGGASSVVRNAPIGDHLAVIAEQIALAIEKGFQVTVHSGNGGSVAAVALLVASREHVDYESSVECVRKSGIAVDEADPLWIAIRSSIWQ